VSAEACYPRVRETPNLIISQTAAEPHSVKIVLIDFHTHSTASDGALSPGDLVSRARANGVALLALTDHDLMRGYQEAAAAAVPGQNPTLVPGIELSCRWSGATIHVVGLGIDAQHQAMESGIAQMAQARQLRAQKIADRLAARGFPGALAGAQGEAGESQLGRPHFARWLVGQGHVKDHKEAFDRLLGQGKPGDVKAFWPELATVVQWITEAGGVAVMAHPLKYRFTGMKLRRLLVDFVAAGGQALEVSSGRQTADQLRHLLRLAKDFELEVSVGSDFHRDAPYSADVGVELTPFAGLPGVWERWL
jgi:predicted metal-dependent phosphoesterase TrpH